MPAPIPLAPPPAFPALAPLPSLAPPLAAVAPAAPLAPAIPAAPPLAIVLAGSSSPGFAHGSLAVQRCADDDRPRSEAVDLPRVELVDRERIRIEAEEVHGLRDRLFAVGSDELVRLVSCVVHRHPPSPGPTGSPGPRLSPPSTSSRSRAGAQSRAGC